MNRLLSGINGGFPLTQEAWKFHQDATFEAIKGLMSAYGVDDSTTVIISGCVRSVSAGTVTVTEGFVSIGGEICRFPEQSYPTPTDLEYFDKAITYDPNGNKAFETSGNQDTRQIVTAKIVIAAAVPAGYTAYTDAKRLFEIARTGIDVNSWIDFVDGDDDAFYGPGQTPLAAYRKYFKDVDGFIHLKGGKVMDDIAVPTDVILGQLPVGYRPPDQLQFTYTKYVDNVSANFFRIQVATNGDITALQVTGNFTLMLHDIPIFKATY